MDIRQTTSLTPGQRQISQATAVASRQLRPAAEEGQQGAAAPEARASHGGSSLKQRVAHWVENSTTRVRKGVMPTRLRQLMNSGITLESCKAKAEAQKKWSTSVKQALCENRSAPRSMIQHDMQLSLNELRARAGKAPAQRSADAAPILPEKQQQLEGRISQLETLNAIGLASDKETMSSWDIDRFLQDSIDEINDSYLSTYTNILSQFNAFFSDFADFKSKISQYVMAGEDGKLEVKAGGIYSELTKLIDKYSNYAFYPPEGKTASKDDAEKWAKEMGLPDSCIVSDGNAGYKVIMDISPLTIIKESIINTFIGVPAGNPIMFANTEIDSAQYQAWLAGFDMQADKYQNFMQVMTQKYTTANSVFDNLIKVLSSTITSLLESDKSFFNI